MLSRLAFERSSPFIGSIGTPWKQGGFFLPSWNLSTLLGVGRAGEHRLEAIQTLLEIVEARVNGFGGGVVLQGDSLAGRYFS